MHHPLALTAYRLKRAAIRRDLSAGRITPAEAAAKLAALRATSIARTRTRV